MLDGLVGCTRFGGYWLGETSYVYWLHDNGTGRFVGVDPGLYVLELDGLVGIPVQLDAGTLTDAEVAAATRSTVSGATGSGNQVTLPGTWTVGGVDLDDRGLHSAHGNRNAAPGGFVPIGGPVNETLATHCVSPASDELVVGINVYLSTADPDELIAYSLWVGGDEADYQSATLVAEAILSASGTGHFFVGFTPEQAAIIPASSSMWILQRGQGSASTAPGFNGEPAALDITDQSILQLDLNPDPNVPATSLAAVNTTANYNLRQMVSVQFATAPYRRPGEWSGRLGVHGDTLLASPTQSEFTNPDPLGANVCFPVRSPDVEGMHSVEMAMGFGTIHTAQVRLYTRYGGASDTDPDGAANTVDYGLTSGSATNAWVPAVDGAGELLPRNEIIRLCVRGNGGGAIRFAAWDSGAADPPGVPTDYIGGALAEYETNSSNANHSTDPIVPPEPTMITVGVPPDSRPGNYGALYLLAAVEPDSAQFTPDPDAQAGPVQPSPFVGKSDEYGSVTTTALWQTVQFARPVKYVMVVNVGATNPVEVSFRDNVADAEIDLVVRPSRRATHQRNCRAVHVRGAAATTVRIYGW